MEQRTVELENVELRAATDDKPRRLVGYAAAFGEATDLGDFREVIAAGAFEQAIEQNDIRALHEHDRHKLLGRTSAGTLRLKEDGKGLRVEIDLPDTTYANDIAKLTERGDLKGMSFGFRVYPGGEAWTHADGVATRTLTAIDLREVTTTSVPAYEGTALALRSVAPEAIEQAKAMNDQPRLRGARMKYRAAQAAR